MTCTRGQIPLTDQQIGGYSLSGCCPIPPYTSHPASQASPRGSSHSKEPKPGRPRLTYLITAGPAWSGWGSEWVASVVRLLRILRTQDYHGPTVHGPPHIPRRHGTTMPSTTIFLAGISWPLGDLSSSQFAIVAQRAGSAACSWSCRDPAHATSISSSGISFCRGIKCLTYTTVGTPKKFPTWVLANDPTPS